MKRSALALVVLALSATGCGDDDGTNTVTVIERQTSVVLDGDALIEQRERGQDSAAKSNVRNMVSELESCWTTTQDYANCDFSQAGLQMGSEPGQVEVSDADLETYIVTAHSESGNTFSVVKLVDENGDYVGLERPCTGSGGCDNGSW